MTPTIYRIAYPDEASFQKEIERRSQHLNHCVGHGEGLATMLRQCCQCGQHGVNSDEECPTRRRDFERFTQSVYRT